MLKVHITGVKYSCKKTMSKYSQPGPLKKTPSDFQMKITLEDILERIVINLIRDVFLEKNKPKEEQI